MIVVTTRAKILRYVGFKMPNCIIINTQTKEINVNCEIGVQPDGLFRGIHIELIPCGTHYLLEIYADNRRTFRRWQYIYIQSDVKKWDEWETALTDIKNYVRELSRSLFPCETAADL